MSKLYNEKYIKSILISKPISQIQTYKLHKWILKYLENKESQTKLMSIWLKTIKNTNQFINAKTKNYKFLPK